MEHTMVRASRVEQESNKKRTQLDRYNATSNVEHKSNASRRMNAMKQRAKL